MDGSLLIGTLEISNVELLTAQTDLKTKTIVTFQISLNLRHYLAFWKSMKPYKYISLVWSVFTPTEMLPLILCFSLSPAICSCCSFRYCL